MLKKVSSICILVFCVNTLVLANLVLANLVLANNSITVEKVYLDPVLGEVKTFVPLQFLVEEINKRTVTPLVPADQISQEEGQILLVDKNFSDWPEESQGLFREIGYQPSVPLYSAKNPERSAVLDFIDRPLNNRWWMESEFERISGWTEAKKAERLVQMGNWETPGPESFYDDVGNVYKSPHVVKLNAPDNDPLFELSDNPGFDWWEEGYSKARLSWMSSMRWPVMQYQGLDPGARYTIRLTGVGEFYTHADGKALQAVTERKETGEIVELQVPPSLTRDGSLRLTWQTKDESHLNWRQHSRLNEVWLIKKER